MACWGLRISIVITGLLYFAALYVVGILAVVFMLSLLGDVMDAAVVTAVLRWVGYLLLALPVYAAARTAGRYAWRYGLVLGVVEGAVVTGLMTFTFSWEGSSQGAVLMRMVPVFVAVLALCLAGAGLAEWRNRRDRAR